MAKLLSKNVSGILLMLLHAIAMAALYVTAKDLTKALHPNQVAFLYKCSILVAIIPWCFYGGIRKNLKTQKMGVHITRATFSIMGTLCFFYSLAGIPIADAAAITYLEHIIILCIGVLYFKEQMTIAKLILITCGFIGALCVTIKPSYSFQTFNTKYIFLFLALLFWAVNNISIKVLGKTERTKAQLFYVMLIGTVVSLPLAIHDWRPIKPEHIKLIVLLAVLHLIHSVSFFKAFKFSDISAVMPLDYTRLIFTGILGYLLLGEVPNSISMVGYALIMLGGIYLFHDEGRKKGFIANRTSKSTTNNKS